MSILGIWRVIYHYEKGALGGAPHPSGWLTDFVGAAFTNWGPLNDGHADPAVLAAVLSSNGRAVPAGYVLVFDSISNAGPGALLS